MPSGTLSPDRFAILNLTFLVEMANRECAFSILNSAFRTDGQWRIENGSDCAFVFHDFAFAFRISAFAILVSNGKCEIDARDCSLSIRVFSAV